MIVFTSSPSAVRFEFIEKPELNAKNVRRIKACIAENNFSG